MDDVADNTFICVKYLYINLQSINVSSYFRAQSFIFLLHSSLTIHSMLLIPFSLTPVVTSYIHECRGLPFLLLPGGHHSKNVCGSISSFILHTLLFKTEFLDIYFSLITLFLFFFVFNISAISLKKSILPRHKFLFKFFVKFPFLSSMCDNIFLLFNDILVIFFSSYSVPQHIIQHCCYFSTSRKI